jgi:HSP20 family protein
MNTLVKFPTAVNPFNVFVNDFFNHAQAPKYYGQQAVNIYENAEGFKLQIVAPGYKKEHLKVSAENDLLTITANVETEAQPEGESTIKKQYSTKAFTKTFNLDAKVNTDNIWAQYENGILNVWLPKVTPTVKVVKEVAIG